ncbi:transmembrane protein, putative [Medicago truncatula]|uniref:Transmembrane protein, putative n=1 Tax=Medicago truncatula TaxID=3880 RepID=A0A072UI37_MEDTR|nr:transmembrane protein, putative [Medicago truncatula]
MVKEANIVIFNWNLCIQLLKSIKSDILNLKLSFFGFLNHCPKSTGEIFGSPVGMVGPISGWNVILPVSLRSSSLPRWFLLCFAIAGTMLFALEFRLANLGHSITGAVWHSTLPPDLGFDFFRDRCGLPNYRFP